MVIGAELADRVSPVAALRPETLIADGSLDCWACGAPFTTCTHNDFSTPGPTATEEVMALVAQRGAQQTTQRGPGRPPKPPVVAEQPVEPLVGPAVPVTADPTPTQASTPPVTEPAAVPAVATEAPVRPPGPIGADYGLTGAQSISPLAPGVAPAQAPDPFSDGDPSLVRDVVDVPPGMVHPDDDPHRPRAVVVSDESRLFATGAWMTLPGGTHVALTREVQVCYWQIGSPVPLYRMLAGVGSVFPKPATAGR